MSRRRPLRSLALVLDRRLPFDLRALKLRVAHASKEVLGFAVRFGGLWFLARHTYLRGKVGILVYHDPSPAALERHLAYLARRYRFVPLDTVVRALQAGDWSSIQPRSLVLTLDDGHRGNRDLLDVLDRFGVTPTVFVCTQIVATRRRFWWSTLDAPTRHHLFRVSNRERLEILRVQFGFDPSAESSDGEPEALSREDLDAMRSAVDFQPHTRFHPLLPACDDEEAELEIAGSRRELAALTGADGRHFSYPHGRFGEREVALVRRSGYVSARTFDGGFVGEGADPYRLPAVGIHDAASLNAVAVTLTLPRLAPL
jgi:peptidoglycan/xylan/chitin deacetylase (PgdA/CDA1 family)